MVVLFYFKNFYGETPKVPALVYALQGNTAVYNCNFKKDLTPISIDFKFFNALKQLNKIYKY
ncbi:hypothetical protein CRYUN_Cryun06bG0113100 [Craigia yunnanensis]